MAFKLMYYHIREHPKNDKVVSNIYINVVDEKMEYTYITSFFWFVTRYTHIICIKLKYAPQYSRHVPHHSRYALQYSRHVPHHSRYMYPITPAICTPILSPVFPTCAPVLHPCTTLLPPMYPSVPHMCLSTPPMYPITPLMCPCTPPCVPHLPQFCMSTLRKRKILIYVFY